MNFPWNKDAPFGLPEGTVRAIFSGMVITTFLATVLVLTLRNNAIPDVPPWFLEVFLGALAYYGISRHLGGAIDRARARKDDEAQAEQEIRAAAPELLSRQVLAISDKLDTAIALSRAPQAPPQAGG